MSVRLLATFAAIFASLIPLERASAQRVGAPTDDLTNLSVDDLFRLEVTSVDRKSQELSKAPAAIYVLTAEDIRRSGATSIPEALEGVPGLTVQSVDGRMWSISARGSARLYSDKMLVLIDGRSLYTPLFSGVLWDMIDVPLENIERIEIVRGPGAVMWGPNAVNGVINIITKKARDTAGGLVSVEGGNDVYGSLFSRWAAAPTNNVAYQVWAKLEDQNPADSSTGVYSFLPGAVGLLPQPVTDLNTATARLGFRVDAQLSEKDQLTVEGDFFTLGRTDELVYPLVLPSVTESESHTSGTGGFVEGRWTHTNSAGNESSLQFTFDKDQISFPFLQGDVNNLTLDFQKRVQTSERNEVYWSAGFQHYWDSTDGGSYVAFQPASASYYLGDAAVRDELQLIPNRFLISAGIRVDYTSYSHFDYQPSLRFLYTPSSRQSLWLALSRANRVPSRVDRDITSQQFVEEDGFPILESDRGSTSIRPETENSLELGYRLQSGQRWSADIATFWSYYTDLVAVSVAAQPTFAVLNGVPELIVNLQQQNAATARSYGGEVSATWQVTPSWRLMPSYSYIDISQRLPPNYAWFLDSSSYRNQGALRSRYDLTRHWQLDVTPRMNSRDATYNLPGALLLDARIGWRPTRDTEFSFSMQNVTGKRMVETFAEDPFVSIPIRRTFLVRFVQRF